MRRLLAPPAWLADNALLLEAFIAINLAFLTLDIYVAHSVNAFRHWAEWIPFYFSIAGALAVAVGVGRALLVGLRGHDREGVGGPEARRHGDGWTAEMPPATRHTPGALIATGAGRWTGLIVGWTSIAVGISGLLWHLQSHFFRAATLKNLVYSAPFIAPLAYTGIGFLLLVNRLVPHWSRGWARWALFLAWGGFLGNFVLSLLDHAQNGFYYWTEWIPVAVSALAVGFTLVSILAQPARLLLMATAWVLVLQVVTGVLGLGLHLRPLLNPSAAPLLDRLIHGAPVFAPLLFVNLALLAGIGVWDLWRKGAGVGDLLPHGQAPVLLPEERAFSN
jgi:hypothetical protein